MTVIQKMRFQFRLLGFIGLVCLLGTVPALLNAQQAESDLKQSLAMHDKVQQDGTVAEELQQIIKVNLVDVTIEQALTDLAEKTDLKLMYSKALLPSTKKVTLQEQQISLNNALWKVLDGTGLRFALSQNRQLILMKMQEVTKADAPQETITGNVTDATSGETLPAVNVSVKGATIGTSTDNGGRYELEVPSLQDTLVFSFVGYQTREEPISGRTEINIQLTPAAIMGEEMVVVGYGTTKKSDLTGAISTVDQSDLPKIANTSVQQMLSGKAAGVQVVGNDAQPGGAMEVLIRGAASTGAGNAPLYIVDGFPVSGGTDPGTGSRYSKGNRSPLNSINPNDIASIEVLKDASATAIYGARAANGVILITTKSGGAGKERVQVDYDVNMSIQDASNPQDMLNASEWMEARNRYEHERWKIDNNIGVYGDTDPNSVTPFTPRYTSEEIANAGSGTNWFDQVTHSGKIQEHNLSVSGASGKTNYFVSANYNDQIGIVKGNDFNRVTGRLNLSQQINKWIKIGTRATGSQIKFKNPTLSTGIAENTGVIEAALSFTPTLPVKRGDGSFSHVPNSTFFPNPVSLLDIHNQTEQNRLLVQSFVELEPLEGLMIRSQLGFDKQEGVTNLYLPKTTLYGAAAGGKANINQNNKFDQLFNTTVSYEKDLTDKHRFKALLGYEWQSMNNDGYGLGNSNFSTDAFLTNNIEAGESERPDVSSYKNVNELASYFGRLNYNFDDTYLATFTMRADGSSRFGKGNRFGYFPSGSIAWRLSQENFMQDIDWVSNAKIRISAGQTGNSNISGAFAYYSFGRNYIFGSSVNAGAYLSSYANPNLRWETTTEYNIGLDLGFLNERIKLTTELFSKEVSDLLGSRQLKTYLPLDQVSANLGTTTSKGFEVTLNTINTTGDLTWSSDFNISAYRDRWKERSPDVVLSSYESETDPLRVHWGYVLDGLVQPGEEVPHMPNALPGTQKVKDLNGDGIINDQDVVKIANADPDFTFGFSNTFNYKNFDLNFHVYGMVGIMKYNSYLGRTREMHPNIGRGWNIPDLVDKFWSSENQDAQYPNIYGNNPFPGGGQALLQNADFIRVKNITLGYTITDVGKLNRWLNRVRIYANASNPFLFTSFEGIDPEFSGIYPPSKTLTLGLKVQL